MLHDGAGTTVPEKFGEDLTAIGNEHYELGYVALDPYHATSFGQDFYSSDKYDTQHKWYDAS
eukprot:11786646-Karenia_brevis.AAC.1